MTMMMTIACRLPIQLVSRGEVQAMNERRYWAGEICKEASRTSDPNLGHQSEQLVLLKLPLW
jgi:hypothetical protein